ncbi:MAG: hypothetical protein QP761_04630 [Campylobacter ureolyticus]|nr:hypothetical protein [Campylobacter ureolyticus]MDK8323171.1 hypothetical protein [Campylobacter ureolyticus]
MKEFEKFKTTIKIISYDKNNCEYMSNSQHEAFNLDLAKDDFMQDLSKNNIKCQHSLCSNDGIFKKNNEVYFIEFKNGKIFDNKNKIKNNCKKIIYYKILHSIFIFLSYTSRYTKDKIHYILVYNKEKNSDRVISQKLNNYANNKKYILDLSFFERYFKTINCYDKNDFEKFINL